MTPAEFFLAMRGHNEAIWKQWQHTRVMAYTTFAVAPRKGRRRVPSMRRWMPLPSDKRVQNMTSNETMDAVFKKLRQQGKLSGVKKIDKNGRTVKAANNRR